jgi:hypothetical protein
MLQAGDFTTRSIAVAQFRYVDLMSWRHRDQVLSSTGRTFRQHVAQKQRQFHNARV